ncbi:hypothetical protein EGW08_018440 [Elysia chlorotica]|uniref:Potassium channel domain-containing protein n=1 Tax=Elysia chlorotica TaxID=188477 RepID=A0A3S1AW40_ELYCH|nr:hypothetical protein EGW08_018440 [Elysia chlorotica]
MIQGVRRHASLGKTFAALAALLIIMFGYVLLGATIFLFIEGTLSYKRPRTQEQEIRDATLEKLVELHELNFTGSNTTFRAEVLKELIKYTRLIRTTKETEEQKWTYDASLLYVVSLVTTVGYGNLVPTSSPGRVATIVYSVVGIPLTLVCLGMMGTIMARGFKFVAVFLFEDVVTEEGEAYIPLRVSLGVMFSYLFLGAVLFKSVEPAWTFLESFYYCFITLSTIGLGDYVYGADSEKDTQFVVSVFYLMFGLSLLSMCFNLMQDQALYQLYDFLSFAIKKYREYANSYSTDPRLRGQAAISSDETE